MTIIRKSNQFILLAICFALTSCWSAHILTIDSDGSVVLESDITVRSYLDSPLNVTMYHDTTLGTVSYIDSVKGLMSTSYKINLKDIDSIGKHFPYIEGRSLLFTLSDSSLVIKDVADTNHTSDFYLASNLNVLIEFDKEIRKVESSMRKVKNKRNLLSFYRKIGHEYSKEEQITVYFK